MRGVGVDSVGSSGDGVAKEQGEGAGVGPRVGGGSGVVEMRLLREAERGMRSHKGKCRRLEIFSFTDSLVDRKIPFLPPLSGIEDLVLHRRWSSGLSEKATGGGPW